MDDMDIKLLASAVKKIAEEKTYLKTPLKK
jgi:hypothetical protein